MLETLDKLDKSAELFHLLWISHLSISLRILFRLFPHFLLLFCEFFLQFLFSRLKLMFLQILFLVKFSLHLLLFLLEFFLYLTLLLLCLV